MPYVLIQTDVKLDPVHQKQALNKISQRVAKTLGKPAKYMMCALAPLEAISFGETEGKSAFVEVMAIGLPREKIQELATGICELVAESFCLEPSRVYAVFRDVLATHWAWNGKTFG